ncbi:hypothetical protein MIMGU_mgv1a019137mg [Erythranthe guttata]|uniref:AAA+ ATPase domain-containing protein n=1 Tax=Erythranthe guttata TaxID=4155 RepID=A0A022QLD0_ERYGU|nr:hypothetical protein MIMGU_mgv1a019137mg [Erythranthe guttata]
MVRATLHSSAGQNIVDSLKCLLDPAGAKKVNLEAKNAKGETALHVAAKNGSNDAAKMLLESGANVDARTNKSMTPLHLAVSYAQKSGQNSIVKTLLEYKADCSAKDSKGMTPFKYLRAGLKNEELMKLVGQNIVAHQAYIFRGHYSKIKGKLDEFEDQLSKIVGLDDLKLQFKTWAKGIVMDDKRRAMGTNLGPRKQPHMVFLGNPGTGKTMVARILGKLLQSIGVLSSDKVIEVQRTDLVGEYIGQKGPKTRKKIVEAMGGILFVDEAYQLVPTQRTGNYKDFGVEALEEIMSVLEDGDIVVIFAGYTEPMKLALSSNQGLCRRVTNFFQFDDFTCKDLAQMLMLKMTKQDERSRLYGFKLHPSCTCDAVLQVIQNNSTEQLRSKMNGGLVDHMLNNARENLDSRLNLDSIGDELLTITLSDLEAGITMLSKRANVDSK